MDVVVVESPAKAKTINKYLGKGYTVLASYGHVRDLPPKEGSVKPDDDFAISWEVDGKANKRLQDIIKAVKGAEHLYLATDPDREGEAISWHVQEILKQRHALKGVDVKRVVFNEVTKSAVQEAFKHPRELDNELVDAYLARRALDYLVGFTLSPVLWRKLPGSRSAGRVQSVALRLICEREAEIEIFKPREYWSIEVDFATPSGERFTARLTHLDGKRLDRFDLGDEKTAREAAEKIARQTGFAVREIERKQVRRNPPPPFTTSTLQQEASRKLGMTASRTMRIAQRLYEGVDIDGDTVGLITYMRTDGVALSNEAIASVRSMIEQEYGRDYRPDEPRIYRTQAKNAQEAHEAIRPTDMHRQAKDVVRHLDDEQRRLYELIWKRAVASQMATALIDQVGVDITSPAGDVMLRATGSTIAFNGYLTLYSEDVDDAEEDEENRRLPPLKERDALDRGEIKPEQHFTQPPPRYSEASLVKKLEELGIGRPSTYASIIQVLQDRNYVRIDKKRFIPEDRGRLVTAFLAQFFERYVQYDFTADLENQLDDISGGRIAWKKVLEDFWRDFSTAIGGTKDLKISDVINSLDETLGEHFFPAPVEGGKDPRVCPVCGAGRLGLKLGRFGAFIGCSNYPECKFTRPLGIDGDGAESSSPRELGVDPETKVPITLKKGPYGFYVQRGEGNPDEKPKRASIPKTIPVGDVDLDKALRLLALPRELGPHPEGGEIITAAIGRFGPYLKHGKEFRSLPKDDDILTIGLNRAVSLLAEPKQQRRGMPTPIKSLGLHPSDGEPINIFSGRYGPYVAHGGVNATIRDVQPEELTVEQAIALLAARPQPKGKKKAAAPKAKALKKAKKAQDDATPADAKAPKQKAAAKDAVAPKTTNGKKTAPKPKGKAAKKKQAAG
ncbi:MAG TPA: type I DNA topoisomerase [Stellaceae bacterium]|jgi:DNA topoisomerase-1|nr:type I DNA topoisomerase [Stellaceae bacterium]